MSDALQTSLSYIKGVGPQKAELLQSELGLKTVQDLLEFYPFRHEDRSSFHKIAEIVPNNSSVQLKGTFTHFKEEGIGRKKRLKALFSDDSGRISVIWFKGISYHKKAIEQGKEYVLFGKPALFQNSISIAHPEITDASEYKSRGNSMVPVYRSTEKLRNRYLDSRAMVKIVRQAISQFSKDISENLPSYVLENMSLVDRKSAFINIHFPESHEQLDHARRRIKFEELFFLQVKAMLTRSMRNRELKSRPINKTELLTIFYEKHLPFPLTEAQKRVIKEIFSDLKSGNQMNRLLQGDVGSGKTIVAFICSLIAVSSGTQVVFVAPTEILAQQHFEGLLPFAEKCGLIISLLTGSVSKANRKPLHQELRNGTVNILVGTHAVFEEEVQFKDLGLCIIDEQHRFGVAQRARLWKKNEFYTPHILVMTATPIPRTLAMTLYGDLEVSVIDELPPGRKEVRTVHRTDAHRLSVFGFVREEIKKGRQVYFVYPLIEESEKLDYKDLEDGYESVKRAFPEIENRISILHGRMKADAKEFEMARFKKGETKIMVATTVIEVGVNVPNASVMIIENAEKYGLSQLHQLRGRVGRGSEQSYCILMTKGEISKDAKTRIGAMVRTNDGFDIANTDLQLRGPGDMMGTRQSGLAELKLTNLNEDKGLIQSSRTMVQKIFDRDPKLMMPQNQNLKKFIAEKYKKQVQWFRIS